MLSKIENPKRIEESGIVAVIRAKNPDRLLKLQRMLKLVVFKLLK